MVIPEISSNPIGNIQLRFLLNKKSNNIGITEIDIIYATANIGINKNRIKEYQKTLMILLNKLKERWEGDLNSRALTCTGFPDLRLTRLGYPSFNS